MKSKTILILSLLAAYGQVSALNVLGLFSCASPSHNYWNMAVVKALAAKGYNLTVLSPDLVKNLPPNIHFFHLDKIYETLFEGPDGFDFLEFSKQTAMAFPPALHKWHVDSCKGAMASKAFKTLYNYPDDFKFDLVLYDFVLGPCLLGFLHKFRYPPMAGLTSFSIPPWYEDLVGGQKPWAYAPMFALDYTNEMNFWQRSFNAFLHLYAQWMRNYKTIPAMDEVMRTNFNYSDLPYAGDLDEKTAILLVNYHSAVDYPEPIPPNVIPLGGLHIEDPKPLPKDLEAFVSKGKKGSVLMSLGTNMRSDLLGNATVSAILRVFEQLPDYNFVWKFESDADSLPVRPTKNVLMTKWVPQNDFLAHPRTRAFVSHCGLLSTQEASWWGVPVVAVPCFADQHRNAAHLVHSGSAVRINWQEIHEKNFRQALLDVLEDPSIQRNMKKRSARFRDQPMRPLDGAVWWLEWLLRNPQPNHMRVPTIELGLVRRNLWDVYLATVLALTAVFYATWRVIRFFLLHYSIEKPKNKMKKN